jgi:hypothetical protein
MFYIIIYCYYYFFIYDPIDQIPISVFVLGTDVFV